MKTKKELKEFYEGLKEEFEGYIQMSDEKLNKIFTTKQSLPSWNTLHNGKNFILEACLFDADRSITIRQVNDKFAVIDEKLSDFKDEHKTQEQFLAKSIEKNINLKAKITQIWEEKEDEYCLNIKVLKPTLQLFSGFEIVGDNK
ncbi:TIGR04423 family type III CRISPR-associated protein [Arcobacter sp. AHV-9/2010]|uniref:TIGR04423 family type III CRISPR-associated protein n=1 Tax=Arcobacter sp. AHV-9/2010 TaxID=2021861 RepID=UPI00100A6080|nr:TIGR04423 family type III CRISPR-associated protein [Arcobacter sp. CECT 9299]RXJ95767.1 TIGR04423 family type III CRISPR-associated protein [Arcobacter sp. CECT 9299]